MSEQKKKSNIWMYVAIVLGIWVIASFMYGGEDSEPVEIIDDEEMLEETSDTLTTLPTTPSTLMHKFGSPAGKNLGVYGDPIALGLSENDVLVSDQPAGSVVKIDAASVAQSTWLAVYEVQDDVPVRVLGAQRFDTGTYEGAQVQMVVHTKPGQHYQVLLQRDNGDRKYDRNSDPLITDGIGNVPISFSFFTQ